MPANNQDSRGFAGFQFPRLVAFLSDRPICERLARFKDYKARGELRYVFLSERRLVHGTSDTSFARTLSEEHRESLRADWRGAFCGGDEIVDAFTLHLGKGRGFLAGARIVDSCDILPNTYPDAATARAAAVIHADGLATERRESIERAERVWLEYEDARGIVEECAQAVSDLFQLRNHSRHHREGCRAAVRDLREVREAFETARRAAESENLI